MAVENVLRTTRSQPLLSTLDCQPEVDRVQSWQAVKGANTKEQMAVGRTEQGKSEEHSNI